MKSYLMEKHFNASPPTSDQDCSCPQDASHRVPCAQTPTRQCSLRWEWVPKDPAVSDLPLLSPSPKAAPLWVFRSVKSFAGLFLSNGRDNIIYVFLTPFL